MVSCTGHMVARMMFWVYRLWVVVKMVWFCNTRSLVISSVFANTISVAARPAPAVVETDTLQAYNSCIAAVGHQFLGILVVVIPLFVKLVAAPRFEGGFERPVLLCTARPTARTASVIVTTAPAYQLVGWATTIVVWLQEFHTVPLGPIHESSPYSAGCKTSRLVWRSSCLCILVSSAE